VKRFFDELYASQVDVEREPMHQEDPFLPFLEAEVSHALRHTKGGKAPGPDRIPAELLRAGSCQLTKPLTSLLNAVVREGAPPSLADSNTVLLHKKGDAQDIGNFRPISLISSSGKLLSKAIANRVESRMETHLSDEQFGFRRGRSTTDAIFVISELIAKSYEYQFGLNFAFVDFRKAFDSVEANAVYNALQDMEVEGELINTLQSVAATARSTISIGESRVPIEIRRGVQQGDAFSPRAFIAALESAIGTIDWGERGVLIDGRRLTHIAFADDVALVASTTEELQTMLDDLDAACTRIGLSINEKKTVTMGNLVAPLLQLRESPIASVASFIYLGRLVSFSKDRTAELRRRIGAAWGALNQHRDFYSSRRTPQHLKCRLFNTVVLPTLLYAAETWTHTESEWKELAVAQRRMERVLVGVRLIHRRSNDWLRGRSGVLDARCEAEKRKMNWARKLAEMSADQWPRRVVDWTPRDRARRSGGQRPRWRDSLVKKLGSNWLHALRRR